MPRAVVMRPLARSGHRDQDAAFLAGAFFAGAFFFAASPDDFAPPAADFDVDLAPEPLFDEPD